MSACKTPSGVPGSDETRDVLEAAAAKMLHVAMHPDAAEEGDGSSHERPFTRHSAAPKLKARMVTTATRMRKVERLAGNRSDGLWPLAPSRCRCDSIDSKTRALVVTPTKPPQNDNF